MTSSHSSDKPQSFLGAWIVTVLLIVTFVVGLILLPPSFDVPASDQNRDLLFFGRFHPILVHTPVGALLFLIFIELFCLSRRGEERYGPAALLALLVGTAGAIMAVFAGIMLSREGGYLGGNFTLHQSMGIIGTCGVLLALVIRVYAMGQGSFDLLHAYRAIFIIAFSIMGLGAHFGGNMSHGNKFLTEHARPAVKSQMTSFEKLMFSLVTPQKEPEQPVVVEAPTKPTLSQPPSIPEKTPPVPAVVAVPPLEGEKLVFQDVVLPIFAAKCNKCHSEEKQKGDLRLDTYEMVMKGGENGANIVPGKPEESRTFQLVTLAEEDDDRMPPSGKEPLTEGEVALLRWWIQQGASNTQKVNGAQMPPEVKAVVDQILKVALKFSAPNPANS